MMKACLLVTWLAIFSTLNCSEDPVNTNYLLLQILFGKYIQYHPPIVPQLLVAPTMTPSPLPPPPRPVIHPTLYFSYANAIPIGIYSSYLCGVLSQPFQVPSPTYSQITYDTLASGQLLVPLSQWLNSQTYQPLPSAYPPPNQFSYSYDEDASSKLRHKEFKRFGNRLISVKTFKVTTMADVLKSLRNNLIVGYSKQQISELRTLLNDNLTSSDLELALEVIYDAKNNLTMNAANIAQTFFVKDPASTSKFLAESDRKRLYTEIILAANGRGKTADCQLDFQTPEDIVRVVYRNILPSGMSRQEIINAENGMVFLSKAKLNRQEIVNIFDNLLQDHPKIDQPLICFILHNYAISSQYCSVRGTANLVYERLRCEFTGAKEATTLKTTNSDQQTTDSTPATSSTTQTTTTTTPTTTSTPTTTTTLPTATTATTTITTPATTSTPTTTTTQTAATTSTTTTSTTTSASAQCGVSDITSDVGGVAGGSCGVYPWIVRLIVNGYRLCGGAILDSTHILTAAQCTADALSITATVGEYDSTLEEGTEQVFEVSVPDGVSQHPGFSFQNQTNDISTLTLSTPIDMSRICAKPVCLNPTYQLTSGQQCKLAGWGRLNENDALPSDTLQTTTITTYQGGDCAAAFPDASLNYISDPSTQLCAGQPAGGVDACAGDSGGPLFCLDRATNTWNVVGVISYGKGCAMPGIPAVFTNTAAYYSWIQLQL
ncbi:serine protease 56 [Biomphalaria pfeifferi]|uniref:Serine protease 56 n=1 Tax=Biomphalaria pfeifferi TaxID=112525 RepID=A0AAD8BPS9_BIOPF|nr:serine protease 56 [Biomphalaria pfeifferi]